MNDQQFTDALAGVMSDLYDQLSAACSHEGFNSLWLSELSEEQRARLVPVGQVFHDAHKAMRELL